MKNRIGLDIIVVVLAIVATIGSTTAKSAKPTFDGLTPHRMSSTPARRSDASRSLMLARDGSAQLEGAEFAANVLADHGGLGDNPRAVLKQRVFLPVGQYGQSSGVTEFNATGTDRRMQMRRTMVRTRVSIELNAGASRSNGEIITVPADKILVIETLSASISIPETTPLPEVVRFEVVTGSASPAGGGSPLIDLPVTKMATDPVSNFVNFIALSHMRAYATDGLVQFLVDFSAPTAGGANVSLFGYLLSANDFSLAP